MNLIYLIAFLLCLISFNFGLEEGNLFSIVGFISGFLIAAFSFAYQIISYSTPNHLKLPIFLIAGGIVVSSSSLVANLFFQSASWPKTITSLAIAVFMIGVVLLFILQLGNSDQHEKPEE